MDSRYEVFETLGQNHYSVVKVGRDLNANRDVAILELLEQFRADPARWTSIWRQILELMDAKLENVVAVYDVVESRRWIVMEQMQGNLRLEVARKALSPNLVRSVLRQVLVALQSYHAQGVLHGDVKPANLLFNREGYVRLSFSPGLQLGGQIPERKADFKYLAPELLNPALGGVTPALDLYGLGFTALELLRGPDFDTLFKGVGKNAIDADGAWMRWQSSAADVLPSVSELVPGTPADLVQVIDRLLNKAVDERYPSAEAALRDLAEGPTVTVVTAPVKEPTRPLPPVILGDPVIRTGGGHSTTGGGKPPRKPVKKTAAPFTKEWINQKCEDPKILAGVLALIIVPLVWFLFTPTNSVAEPTVVKLPLRWSPTTATARLDDKQLTETSGAEITLAIGKHTLALTAAGFEPLSTPFEVTAETREIPPFEMRRKPVPPPVTPPTPPKPRLPDGLVAVAGAVLDPQVKLPTRAQALRLGTGESALELSLIPAGEFRFGAAEPLTSELPERTAVMEAAYYLGQTEVTNSQFAQFAKAAGLPADHAAATRAREREAAGQGNQPVLEVSFEDAQNFCRWISRDGDLPSEQEWERAARGQEGRQFPWIEGGSLSASKVQLRRSEGDAEPCAVDALPDGRSPEGLAHLLGNAAEWCRDLYLAGHNDREEGFPGIDEFHVIRGASFRMPAGPEIRSTWRSNVADAGAPDVGFRVCVVARNLPAATTARRTAAGATPANRP